MGDSVEDADRLRNALVDQLRGDVGVLHDRRVIAALRAVPRHVFVPEVSLEDAYANQAVITKKDAAGMSVSSVSQPSIVAIMLEQLRVEPGHRVLEIGAGTGYNATLLAELVGPDGAVTTVDIDADTVDRARHGLAAAGYDRVRVSLADGWYGAPDDAPYDRIILTVGAADLSPAWWEQLVPGGLLVLPLQLRGSQRSIAFERAGDRWKSRSITACGFIPMRGAGGRPPVVVPLADDGSSLWVDPDENVDVDALSAALSMPSVEVLTGVRLRVEDLYGPLDLYLALTFDHFARLRVGGDHPTVTPALPWGSPTLVRSDSFAYLSREESAETDPEEFELGVRAHGPHASELATALAGAISAWDRDRDSFAELEIEAYPAGAAESWTGTHRTIDTPHARLVLSCGMR